MMAHCEKKTSRSTIFTHKVYWESICYACLSREFSMWISGILHHTLQEKEFTVHTFSKILLLKYVGNQFVWHMFKS